MKGFHKFRIVLQAAPPHGVELDGKALSGVKSLRVSGGVDEVTTVSITFVGVEVEVVEGEGVLQLDVPKRSGNREKRV